jgi:hypothetical protein
MDRPTEQIPPARAEGRSRRAAGGAATRATVRGQAAVWRQVELWASSGPSLDATFWIETGCPGQLSETEGF